MDNFPSHSTSRAVFYSGTLIIFFLFLLQGKSACRLDNV